MEDRDGVEVLAALVELEEATDRLVAAKALASVYALALRFDVAPRTIVNAAFVAAADDERWHDVLKPALQAELEK